MKILFMCVANSARSQMAEGLAKQLLGDSAWIESAGSEPKNLNPHAVSVLKEVGINISNHYSKSAQDLSNDFLKDLDYVITLCAEEVCPVLISKTAKKLHWPFPDPAAHTGAAEEQIKTFRQIRDSIKSKLQEFAGVLEHKN